MRHAFRAALMASVLIGTWASAQSVPSLGRVGNVNVVNTPIDTSNVIAPTTNLAPQAMRFNFGSVLRKLPLFGGRPSLGSSAIPAPSTFQGANYPSKLLPVAPK